LTAAPGSPGGRQSIQGVHGVCLHALFYWPAGFSMRFEMNAAAFGSADRVDADPEAMIGHPARINGGFLLLPLLRCRRTVI